LLASLLTLHQAATRTTSIRRCLNKFPSEEYEATSCCHLVNQCNTMSHTPCITLEKISLPGVLPARIFRIFILIQRCCVYGP